MAWGEEMPARVFILIKASRVLALELSRLSPEPSREPEHAGTGSQVDHALASWMNQDLGRHISVCTILKPHGTQSSLLPFQEYDLFPAGYIPIPTDVEGTNTIVLSPIITV